MALWDRYRPDPRLQLAAIVESSDDAIVSKTLDGIITTWNAAATRLFGYTADEIIGKSILTLIPPDLHPEESEILSKLRAGKRIDHYETKRLKKNGELVDVSLTISPIKDSDGLVIGASKIARDITERKKAELALQRVMQFDESVMNNMGEGLYTVDRQGLLTFMNPAAENLFGWKLEELRGRKMHDVTHYKHRDGAVFPMNSALHFKS